ncbi:MAG: methyltransferase domain-containing protein [Balneolaceae bacterium]|nr:methyltransferase domain-containing protein [Balneolaceae bacterium]
MKTRDQQNVAFLQWVLPKMGYRWAGFRKPRNQVMKRVWKRAGDLGFKSLEEYRAYLKIKPDEWEKLDGLMNVTISRFFRDRKLWDGLSKKIFPEMANKCSPDSVRIWSAGCCNGEEPYSVCIAAEKSGIYSQIDVLAADRNPEALGRAKKGHYPPSSLKELTKKEKEQFFHWNEQIQLFEIDKRLKKQVTFEKLDISKSLPDGTFDLIFCRNLAFTYFLENEQKKFLKNITELLRDGGCLIIGSNETLPDSASFHQPDRSIPVYQYKRE